MVSKGFGAHASVESRPGGVAIVRIDRPEAHNSLDIATKAGLRDALAAVAADPEVRAVVLTGTGRAFCVGQDLAEHAAALESDPSTSFSTVAEHYTPIVESITTMPKPVIAAVNGACVGAGLGFALACDLRVFSSQARLGTAFTSIGLTCDSALSATLTAEVGAGRARELVLLATPFTPQEAFDWGVAGRLAEPEDVLDAALELATTLAAGPTAAYAASKRLIADGQHRDLAATLAAEDTEQSALGLSADHQGAVRAFLAKEKPTFSGN